MKQLDNRDLSPVQLRRVNLLYQGLWNSRSHAQGLPNTRVDNRGTMTRMSDLLQLMISRTEELALACPGIVN